MTLPKYANELQPQLPHETREWEYKSASVLTDKGQLKECLGKQISAFANSGGGRLVFGIDPKTTQLQACQEKQGNQTMEDYLSNMISECVDDQLQTFHVMRMNFDEHDARCIFIIHVEDSPVAPHQSRHDKVYYWRLPGKSEPAPHFHLKNLYNRRVACIVEATILEDGDTRFVAEGFLRFNCRIIVQNTVGFVARPFGVEIKLNSSSLICWRIENSSAQDNRILLSGDFLFPNQPHVFDLAFLGNWSTFTTISPRNAKVWKTRDAFACSVRAFSQNYASAIVEYDGEIIPRAGILREFERKPSGFL